MQHFRNDLGKRHRPPPVFGLPFDLMSVRNLVFLGLLALAASLFVVLLQACGDPNRIDEACQSNDDCAATELCATGLCEGGLGVCNERPVMCPDTDSPVCGCDDQTYQNVCFADMAGVRLARTGPCIPAPMLLGSPIN